jgi:hypothetical protein
MTQAEAKDYGIPEDERKHFRRIRNSKASHAEESDGIWLKRERLAPYAGLFVRPAYQPVKLETEKKGGRANGAF